MNVYSNLLEAFQSATSVTGGKTLALLLFNKSNGVFFGVTQYDPDHAIDQDYFWVVEDEIDVVYDDVVGTYPDYQIVAKADQPQVIQEAYLNAVASDSITSRFPLPAQVNTIAAALLAIAEAAGLKELPAVVDLQTQVDEIADILKNNSLRKAGYANNSAFTYLTTEEEASAENAKYAGGLHELMGPRTVTG